VSEPTEPDWAALRAVHVPDELVERAARVAWYADENDRVPYGDPTWESISDDARRDYIEPARYVLAAVLTDLRALPDE
jgi:hypothetical protein